MAPRATVPIAIPLLVRVAVSLTLIATGFVAVSDDDFARITIAQSFAEAPRADPTGTSWLPAPFWLYGTIFAVFGKSLAVARLVGVALGVASTAVVFVAARWLGASPKAAAVGATLSCLFPHAAYLGAATVPELPTAALMLLGTAAAAQRAPRRLLIGAGALLVATLSRYEAWPVAACFSVLVLHDAVRQRDGWRALASLAALAGVVAWLLHGTFVHGNTFFFLDRVASYRQALGDTEGLGLGGALWPPLALVAAEPEIAVAVAAAWWLRRSEGGSKGDDTTAALRRAALIGFVLVLFLMVGGALGGTATHHEARPLLFVWLLGSVYAALGLASATPDERTLPAGPLLLSAAASIGLVLTARIHFPRDDFAPRTAERAIGEEAKAHVPSSASLLVGTIDYGYFAVMAAFGEPGRARALYSNDPRDRAGPLDLTAANVGAEYAVIDIRAVPSAERLGDVLARREAFVLVRVRGDKGSSRNTAQE